MFHVTAPNGKEFSGTHPAFLFTEVKIENRSAQWSLARNGSFAECQQGMLSFDHCPAVLQSRIEIGTLR